MADSYVTSKATLKCSCGDRCAKLTVYPDRTCFLTEKPTANISDHVSLYNIAPFGRCHTTAYPPTGSATAANHGHLTPMPCIPGTVTEWMKGKVDYIVRGKPALLKSSYCRCKWGGIITVTDDGQVDTGDANLSMRCRETEEEWTEKEQEELLNDHESLLDGIQTALDVAGLVPGLGSIPDLTNAAIYYIRGDKVNAGLSMLAAVPVIGDAATAAKLAGKGVRIAKAKNAGKGLIAVNKTGKVREPVKDNVASISKYKSIKLNKEIDASDNIARFSGNRVSNADPSKVNVVEKQHEVIKLDNYERKVVKQVNGLDEVRVVKKTDTVVNMDSYSVNRVQPTTKNGSATDYGQSNSFSGRQGDNSKQYGPYKKQNLELKKKNRGLSNNEESLLQQLTEQEKNGSIFNKKY